MKRISDSSVIRGSAARVETLEPRRLFSAATLKHGLLTAYGSDAADTMSLVNTGQASPVATFLIDDHFYSFPSSRITRIRVFGFGGNDSIDLADAYLPNLTDVRIYAGNGSASVQDGTVAHKFNRNERVSMMGGSGNDRLVGGDHTVLIDGGAGNDTLSGGEAGATLNGGDGNDVVSASPIFIERQLQEFHGANDPLGSLVLSGGAGDDVIVGNNLKTLGISDTLSGGSGNDIFYRFGTDQVVDFGVGSDQDLAANQFSGTAQVTQTATLTFNHQTEGGSVLEFPPVNLGNNGPNSRIYVSDAHGMLTMQGLASSTFSLGDLFNAVGSPFALVPIPAHITLTVNGFASPLTGNQIAGYQINNGDSIVLRFPISV